ncbi:MAG: hypothetical protein ABR499_16780 [Gemmatimonadaceae bacterium]
MNKLWQQLLLLWGAATVIGIVLLAFDGWFTRPQRFFWLLPYPTSSRTAWITFWTFFRSRPLLVTAVVGLPAVAVVGTLILVVSRAVRTAASS